MRGTLATVDAVRGCGAKFDFLPIFIYTITDEEDKMSSASLIFKKGKTPLSIVIF